MEKNFDKFIHRGIFYLTTGKNKNSSLNGASEFSCFSKFCTNLCISLPLIGVFYLSSCSNLVTITLVECDRDIRIQSKYGIIRTRKTTNMDTIYAEIFSKSRNLTLMISSLSFKLVSIELVPLNLSPAQVWWLQFLLT